MIVMKKFFRYLFMVLLLMAVIAACTGPGGQEPPTTAEPEVKVTSTTVIITKMPLPPTLIPTQSKTPVNDCGSFNYNGVRRGMTKTLSTNNGEWVTTYMYWPVGDESGNTDSEGTWMFVKEEEGKLYLLFARNKTGENVTVGGNTLLDGFFRADTNTSKIARWEGNTAKALTLGNFSMFAVASPCSGDLVDPVFILNEIVKANGGKSEVVVWAAGDWDGENITVTNFGDAP